MNLFKNSLRLVMATGSILGFLGGWVLFAHSGKPIATTPPLEIMAPLSMPPTPPSINNSQSNLQALPVLPRFSTTMPRLRTRGS